jgi:choline dehydrogenase
VGLTFAATPEQSLPSAIFQVGMTLASSTAPRDGDAAELDLQLLARAALPVEASVSPSGATTMLFVGLMKPRSRGRLWLRSTRPDAAPAIDLGYFTDPADLPRIVEGVRLARRLAALQPFAAIALEELRPGPAVGDGDDALAAAVRERVETYHHPVGTCRMGPSTDPLAVVDARGRVHGVAGLAVVDASMMPSIPAANTHLPTVMVAEALAATWDARG